MITYLKTVHEEQYSDGTKTLGILWNFTAQAEFKESFAFIYNHKNAMYIFFDTMIDMFDYLLYGESKMKRAYMEEAEFDKYYNSEYITNKFSEILKWN